MVKKKTLELLPRFKTPAVFRSDLLGDLTRTDLVQQIGFPQPCCLARKPRAYKEENGGDEDDQEHVDDGDRAPPSAHPFFNSRNGWIHQVSKKDGKEECDEGMPGCVEKRQRQRKQQHRNQNSRRACIDQGQTQLPWTCALHQGARVYRLRKNSI